MEIRYDVCCLSISDINSDARLLNIARTLVKYGKSVSIIAFGSDKDTEDLKLTGIDFFKINDIGFLSANQRWRHFNKEVNSYFNIKANIYWAADFFSLYCTYRLSNQHKAMFFYDSREIYSRVGSLNKSPFKQYIQTKLEKRWVKHVDKIIVSGELDAEYLKKHFQKDVPYYVILNLPPYREAVDADLFREHYPITKEQKIILYQGMLMKGRGIVPVVESLQYIENLVFCLLGAGDFTGQILQKAKECGVEKRVFICGNKNYSELHQWTCSADIGNCFIEPIAFCNMLALPNKMFEYCMAGIPSVISNLPAMKKINEEYQFGKTVPAGSTPVEIANAIKEVLVTDNYSKYAVNCNHASKILCYENQEQTILEIFKELS